MTVANEMLSLHGSLKPEPFCTLEAVGDGNWGGEAEA